jgi:hypothetical protein
MTDLKKLTKLLDQWGVVYEEREKSLPPAGSVAAGNDLAPWLRAISIGTHGPKQVGYGGFVAEFYFDDDEGFVKVGVWE